MAEQYTVSQGSSLIIDVTLRDSNGSTVAGYDGSQDLTTTVWPGGNRSASFNPTTTWTLPSAGTFSITITDEDTDALDPGRYQLLTRLDDAGAVVDVYYCTLDVRESAEGEGPLKTYGNFNDLMDFGRSWLRQLQTSDDEAGFTEQQARARTWFDDCLHAHNAGGGWPVASTVMGGPHVSGRRSTTLQQYLDADGLIVTDQIKEACAKYALSLICEGQVGTGDASAAYSRLANMYRAQAESLACSIMAEIDTDGDGVGELLIDLSVIRPLYG